MSSVKYGCLLLFLLLLTACGEMLDDLTPSGSDQRPSIQAGTTGSGVGQNAPNIAINDINGATVDLDSALAGKKAAVFYFTMWCSACEADMIHTISSVMPGAADVRFFAVDYIASSAAAAKQSANENGFLNSGFTILADVNRQFTHDYAATMGTTIVIDNNKIIRMNELYKGDRLQVVLSGLP